MTACFPKLSQEARSAIGDATSAPKDQNTQWVLARARVMSAGLRLLLHEIDELGLSVKNGWITPEQGAADLAAIEQVPAFVASMIYLPQVPNGC